MRGIKASPGVAIGSAFIVSNGIDIVKQAVDDKNKETLRFRESVETSLLQLDTLISKLMSEGVGSSVDILETHAAMLEDTEFIKSVETIIANESCNAEYAVIAAVMNVNRHLQASDDEYLKERAADIEDAGRRIVSNLSGASHDFSGIPKDSVIFARQLLPSDIVQLGKSRLKALVCEEGGSTSHTAIIARAFGIPAVMGIREVMSKVRNGDTVIVDGTNGEVLLKPDKKTLTLYSNKQYEYAEPGEHSRAAKALPVETPDGKRFLLEANITGIGDIKEAHEYGADGIGLFRTEYVFMNSKGFPTEEEQFEEYKRVVVSMKNKPVTFRTLDIGGDKELPYFKNEKGFNPTMGCRAIRLCLEMKEMFKTQLKAIMRAGFYGTINIMYPMVSHVSEVIKANEILDEAKNELRQKSVPFNENFRVGIMIETPAAAMASDILARYADFFSIGTNDLVQYSLAADRNNSTLKSYYDYFNIGVLRLIKCCIDGAHKSGIRVGLCGEMAADAEAVKILMGFGLDSFSVNPSYLPPLKNIIRNTTVDEAVRAAEEALKLNLD